MVKVQGEIIFLTIAFLIVGVFIAISIMGFIELQKLNEAAQAKAVEIQEEHERTKLLLDAMPITCHLWDRNLKLFYCNEANLSLFGVSDNKEFNDNFADFSPEYQPDKQLSSEASVKYIKKALDDGECIVDWTHKKLDGTLIPCKITLKRVNEGTDVFIASYVMDLREHKQMMEEIDYRDRLLNTVNRTAIILLKSDVNEFGKSLHCCMGLIAKAVGVDYMYIWKNHTVEGQLHCTQLYEWPFVVDTQQDNEKTIVSYDETVSGWKDTLSNGNCVNCLVRDMPPEGRAQLSNKGVLSIFLVPVFLQNQFWGFISFEDCHREYVFSDNEQTILRSAGMLIVNALLHHEMTLRNKAAAIELEAALLKANDANNSKSNFLANMSHEMRTPLNAIIGLSGLTLETKTLNDDTHVNLEKIYNAGLTLLSTVNDILDISKIEAGKFELIPVEYDIPSLINDTVTQNILRINEKPIQFILSINEDLPTHLFGDELRIKQIFNNLLSNAFKYTSEGTVEFGIRCAKEEDIVWVTAWVKDTGTGIRTEDMSRLFLYYNKINTKSNRHIEGTGLGLSITKKMAEMMDGSVTVESEYGKGSLFTVVLKQKFVTDATIGQGVANNLKNYNYSNNKRESSYLTRVHMPYARVLVVDDNATNLDVARGMMKPYEMHVDCVLSGQEAVDAIRFERVRYNAIFMDHMMPGMDGIETTKYIRESIGTEYAKNIPIIALTANAITGNEEMFLSSGFQAFISKPIEMARLDAVIQQWVRDRELEKSLEKQHETDEEMHLNMRSGDERRVRESRRSGHDRRTVGNEIAGLDINKGIMRFGDDEESYIKILRSFATNTRPLLMKIEEVKKDNLSEYATIVHGIKGSSWGISARAVGDKAEALEKAAKSENFEFVRINNPLFLGAAWTLVNDIEDMLDKIFAQNPKSKKDKLDKEVLSRLLTACKNYDIDEIDAAIVEIESFEYESDDELAIRLSENVAQMNYKQVIEELSVMIEKAGGAK
jgi:PAS domain S-box-containing protein